MKKQVQQPSLEPKSTRSRRGPAVAMPGATPKEWSVKVNVRLPHKLGRPLGSDNQCDGA